MIKILPKLLILLLLFSCNHSSQKQTSDGFQEEKEIPVLTPQFFIPEISSKLPENSGMMVYNDLFWGFNDSGGKNLIYGFNESGEVKKEIELKDARNRDWESISQDKKNIYIGDFGNNLGTRENLCIYKIKKKDLKKEKEQKVEIKRIDFSYASQKRFIFPDRSTPFDCEAMVAFEGNLYIFSKNWKNFTTTVYKIPTQKGEYELHPLDTFNVNGLITGADISPDKKQLALVGYKNYKSFIWLFTNFKGDDFFKAESCYYKLDKVDGSQTEGICYYNDSTLLVSCEKSRAFKQQVFLFNLNKNEHGTH